MSNPRFISDMLNKIINSMHDIKSLFFHKQKKMFVRLLVLQNVAVSKVQQGSQNFCSKPTRTEPDKVFHAYTSTSNPTRSGSERKLFHNFVQLCTIAYNYISHINFIILYKNGHIYSHYNSKIQPLHFQYYSGFSFQKSG